MRILKRFQTYHILHFCIHFVFRNGIKFRR
nr:MAG TPA: hypothetical protein [Bacteriophage sp.]